MSRPSEVKDVPIISAQVDIERVDQCAQALVPLSSLSQKKVPIAKVLEGDQWHIQAIKRGRRLRLVQADLVKASPERIKPKCVHFDHCGGCQWQHLPIEKQLLRKDDWARSCLQEHLTTHTIWHTPLGDREGWQYRNKMEFSFSQNKDKQMHLGLHLTRSSVLDIEQCQIAPKWFNHTLAQVRAWWAQTPLQAYHFRQDSGSLRTLTLRSDQHHQKKMAILTVSGNSQFALTQEQIQSFKQAILQDEQNPNDFSLFITIQQCLAKQPTKFFEWHIHGPEAIVETMHILGDQYTFSISPSTFFQPNLQMAQVLYARAIQMANIQPNERVWDLFCGSGTLSIIASKWAHEVIGVELNPMAVIDAQANAKANDRDNVHFKCLDLHKSELSLLAELIATKYPDVVMVDPPRSGLLEPGARRLAQIGPKRIIYISCNPQTQAKDLVVLKEYGYKLSEVQVIDQFGQTSHVETICLLVKDSR